MMPDVGHLRCFSCTYGLRPRDLGPESRERVRMGIRAQAAKVNPGPGGFRAGEGGSHE